MPKKKLPHETLVGSEQVDGHVYLADDVGHVFKQPTEQ